MKAIVSIFSLLLLLTSCVNENYSNGERIGVITQFSRTGGIWKSWEGHLNVTQTGMNSSVPFDFSIDNDREDAQQNIIKTIDSAATNGWKIKLVYHETFNKNWCRNRGLTDHFINEVVVLDRNMSSLFNVGGDSNSSIKINASNDTNSSVKNNKFYVTGGKVIDTIYVVIDKSQLRSNSK